MPREILIVFFSSLPGWADFFHLSIFVFLSNFLFEPLLSSSSIGTSSPELTSPPLASLEPTIILPSWPTLPVDAFLIVTSSFSLICPFEAKFFFHYSCESLTSSSHTESFVQSIFAVWILFFIADVIIFLWCLIY